MTKENENNQERELVDPALCEKCGFKDTPLCTHPDGYFQDEPAGLNKLFAEMNKTPEQKERDQKLVFANLDFLNELFPDEVKEWIYRQWPYALLND